MMKSPTLLAASLSLAISGASSFVSAQQPIKLSDVPEGLSEI
jgi:hypothetical protein